MNEFLDFLRKISISLGLCIYNYHSNRNRKRRYFHLISFSLTFILCVLTFFKNIRRQRAIKKIEEELARREQESQQEERALLVEKKESLEKQLKEIDLLLEEKK